MACLENQEDDWQFFGTKYEFWSDCFIDFFIEAPCNFCWFVFIFIVDHLVIMPNIVITNALQIAASFMGAVDFSLKEDTRCISEEDYQREIKSAKDAFAEMAKPDWLREIEGTGQVDDHVTAEDYITQIPDENENTVTLGDTTSNF